MGRPSKALISRERAAKAALDVIDIQGLQDFSLELVARRLGVKAPSLYHHFKDKDALLAEVALCILQDIQAPPIDLTDWEGTMLGLCRATRRSILQHPNAAPLLLRFFPRHIFLRPYDFWVSKSPYPREVQMAVLEGLEKLTFGSALFAAAARASGVDPMPPFDAARYPNLAQAVRASPYDEEALFLAALRGFLAGFHPLAAKAAPKPKTVKSAKTVRDRRKP